MKPLFSLLALLALPFGGPHAVAAQLIEPEPVTENGVSAPDARPWPEWDGSGEPIRTFQSSYGVVKTDVSGKGAVLCSWEILINVRTMTAACGWERTASDDALDRAIADIDAFIIANSREPITQEMLDARKQADVDAWTTKPAELEAICKSAATEEDSTGAFIRLIRSASPEAIAKGTGETLSIPREPVMNPCL